MPICLSIVNIRLFVPGSYSFDVTNFSTANTIPSLPRKAIEVLQYDDQQN